MASPIPPTPLNDQCSVINDGILYVYSPTAFQTLPLKANATWSQLPNGVSVKGAACVLGQDNGPGSGNALWVVGGSANSSSSDYAGLQKYSFADQAWSSITPVTPVTKNRQSHAAAFVNSTSSILLYAGSQDDNTTPSQETFSISTVPPFNVLSFTSNNVPVTAPIMLPWNDSSVITLGGADSDLQISLFNGDTGSWSQYPTGLPAAVKATSREKATLVSGDDGSVILQLYDMSVSPNQASSIVLQDSNGQPVATGQLIGPPPRKQARQTSPASDFPPYNATNAPTSTRSGFSVAQDRDSGLVAISGGDSSNPVVLFNQSSNGWVDTSRFFNPQSTTSMSTPAPTMAATPSAATSSAPPVLPGASNQHRTAVILGAVLGSVLGFVAILIVALLLLRYKRNQKRKALALENDDEKRRMSFQDRGAPLMMETSVPAIASKTLQSSTTLASSKTHPHHERSETRGSDSSTTRLIPSRKATPGGVNESLEMAPIPEARNSPYNSYFGGEGNRTIPLADSDSSRANSSSHGPAKRTSGWSRYFSGNPLGVGSTTPGRKSGASADTNSAYTSDSNHDCSTHGPTEIPPLKLGQEFDGNRISQMVSASRPQAGGHHRYQSSAATGHTTTSRTRTMGSDSTGLMSFYDDSVFSHPLPEQSQWTPLTQHDWTGSRSRDTATSSIYSQQAAQENVTNSLKPIVEDHTSSAHTSSYTHSSSDNRVSDPESWPRPPSSGLKGTLAQQPQRRAQKPPPLPFTQRGRSQDEDDFYDDDEPYEKPTTPTAKTGIPVPAATAMPYTVTKKAPKATANSDMGWLDLGRC